MSGRNEAVLERVCRVRGVRGAVLVDAADGLVVAEALLDEVESRAIAALAAALVQRLGRTAAGAGLATPAFVHLRGAAGALLAVPAGAGLLVVALTDATANVGHARLELLEAAGQVG
ncbi:MAG TPA: roadblock/LC7 domain-containing protein [Gemmatimonadales bacterium]|nr:roadblock/LC7 domain-containing protein [Gemmatimonadales bacterium]